MKMTHPENLIILVKRCISDINLYVYINVNANVVGIDVEL